MTEADQDARWAQHFSEILSRPPPIVEANIQEAEVVQDIINQIRGSSSYQDLKEWKITVGLTFITCLLIQVFDSTYCIPVRDL